VAEAARDIIALNGLADKITVIAKDARKVMLGEDLPRKADLFVAEIVDNALLGEHVLEWMVIAKTRLLKPGAVLVPQAVAAVGALASG
jgi:type II protein arginine methyltransferase